MTRFNESKFNTKYDPSIKIAETRKKMEVEDEDGVKRELQFVLWDTAG